MFDIFFKPGIKPVSESGNDRKGKIKDSSDDVKYGEVKRRSEKDFREDRKKEIEQVLKNERIRNINYRKTPFKTTMNVNFYNEEEIENENVIKDAKDKITKKKDKLLKKLKAKKNTKKSLIAECLYKMLSDSLGMTLNTGTDYGLMKRNLVESFVMSKDEEALLSIMKETSLPLSDMACLCEEFTERIFQEVFEDDYIIDSKEKDEFFTKLKTVYTDDITDLVRTRVMTAIEDFTQENRNLKADLEENLKKTQEKIDGNSDMSEDVKESFELGAKRRNTDIVENRTKNIFQCMVENISYATVNNEEMKCYTEAETGRLDMVKIVENAKVMYTFMELLNTSKLEKIDESYIKDALSSLK